LSTAFSKERNTAYPGSPGSNPGGGGQFARRSGRILDQSVREVTDRVDMIAVVSDVVELKMAGNSHKGLCPFHTEKTPSFHVNVTRKLYHCYGCGAGGDAIKFVRETRGLSFAEAVEYLADLCGVALERDQASPEDLRRAAQARSERGRMLELARQAQAFFRGRFDLPEGSGAREYAAQRGMTQETVHRFGLGASGIGWSDLTDHLHRQGWNDSDLMQMGLAVGRDSGGVYDRFRHRLMFPIYSAQGDLIGFGGRDLSDKPDVAKYMNSPEITLDTEAEDSRFRHLYKKGDVVFGLWQARESIRRSGRAVLVEGNLDVMTLAQAGIANAVCAMGTALTENQAKALRRFTDRVAVIYDGDAAGQKAADKALPQLIMAGLEGVLVTLPPAEDPDSYVRRFGAEALQKLIDQAPPLLNAYLDKLMAHWDGSIQGKTRILQTVGPLLATMGQRDPISRDMAYDYVIARLGDSHLETGRAQLGRYLNQTATIAGDSFRADEPLQPLDDEPAPMAEQQLAELLLWYPAVLPQFESSGVLDVFQNSGLRLALRDLCAESHRHPMDLDAVTRWAQQLPPSSGRTWMLRWLVAEAPRVPAGQAHGELNRLTAELWKRALREHIEALKAELRQPGATLERKQQLIADLQRADQDLRAFSKGAMRPTASGSTAP
jgi:DNA primase